MKQSITQTTIDAAKSKSKAYEIRDTKVSGFLVRVQPSGRKTYYCEYRRGAREKIGPYQSLSTKQARMQAQDIIARYLRGEDPAKKRKEKRAGISYQEFLDTMYLPWVDANLRSAYEYRRVLNVNCKSFRKTCLKDIDANIVQKWRMKLLASGKTPYTVNRIYTNFRASLSKAEEWGFIEHHPLRKMKPLKTPENTRVRYLLEDEENRLRNTLAQRETKKREERRSANAWRIKRGYPTYIDPDQLAFMDHLKPMILLSMNTGLRRGEIFQLRWSNVNFETKQITVVGEAAKNGKIRHVPLNSESYFRFHTFSYFFRSYA